MKKKKCCDLFIFENIGDIVYGSCNLKVTKPWSQFYQFSHHSPVGYKNHIYCLVVLLLFMIMIMMMIFFFRYLSIILFK